MRLNGVGELEEKKNNTQSNASDQVGFIPEMQNWFTLAKPINVFHNTKEQKGKTYCHSSKH